MFKYGMNRQGVNFDRLDVTDAGYVTGIDRRFRDGQGDYVLFLGPSPRQPEQDGMQ